MLHLDTSRATPLVVYETRDQSIYAAHGVQAARQLGINSELSYDTFWCDNPSLFESLWTFSASAGQHRGAPVIGGLDRGGGTWVAAHRTTGVYARILVAPTESGALGESPTEADRNKRSRAGYVSRSGVCLDAVSLPTAEAAADAMVNLLPRELVRAGARMQPFYLLVGDASSAWVIYHSDTGAAPTAQRVTPGTHVLSVRGLDSPQAALTEVLHDRLAGVPLPGRDPVTWNPWLRMFAASPWLYDGTGEEAVPSYGSDSWRAHRHSAVQPPYLNTPDHTRHARAQWPGEVDAARVEWTKSTTCTAIGPEGLALMMFEERHLRPGAPWPSRVADMSFPETADDYTPCAIVARSGLASAGMIQRGA
ncbi:MAG TPA: NRDE family protein [Streptomyces sp.]|nr:NRDE family protein [Streptomyces sp.]